LLYGFIFGFVFYGSVEFALRPWINVYWLALQNLGEVKEANYVWQFFFFLCCVCEWDVILTSLRIFLFLFFWMKSSFEIIWCFFEDISLDEKILLACTLCEASMTFIPLVCFREISRVWVALFCWIYFFLGFLLFVLFLFYFARTISFVCPKFSWLSLLSLNDFLILKSSFTFSFSILILWFYLSPCCRRSIILKNIKIRILLVFY
jgi:hypothetical protein